MADLPGDAEPCHIPQHHGQQRLDLQLHTAFCKAESTWTRTKRTPEQVRWTFTRALFHGCTYRRTYSFVECVRAVILASDPLGEGTSRPEPQGRAG
jgi:hypothetical protein